MRKRVIALALGVMLALQSVPVDAAVQTTDAAVTEEEVQQEKEATTGEQKAVQTADQETGNTEADPVPENVEPEVVTESEVESEAEEVTGSAEQNIEDVTGTVQGNGSKFKEDGFVYQVIDKKSVKLVKYEGTKKKITIPAKAGKYKVTTIGKMAFYQNETITNVTMADSIVTIEVGAFQWCSNLQKIKLSEKLKRMDDFALSECDKLQEVRLPDSITYLGARCLQGYGIKKITGAANLTCHKYSSYWFQNCMALEEIDIAKNGKLTALPSGTFKNCVSLKPRFS